MLRVGLIAYLMIATLAGPAWCCCTFTRLAAMAAPDQDATDESPSHPCCCHQQSSAQPQNDSDKPSPQEAPCPCKEHNSGQMAAVPMGGQEARDLRCLTSDLDQVNPTGTLIPWVHAEIDGANNRLSSPAVFPGFTGRDILCAYQILRC